MKKFLIVAFYEYRRHVFRVRFFFLLFSLPIFTVLAFGVIYLIVQTEQQVKEIGFVDYANIISNELLSEQSGLPNPIIRFDNESEADIALNNKKINAYFVIENDYRQSGSVHVVAEKPLDSFTHSQFVNILRSALLNGQPQEVIDRINQGNQIVIRSLDGTRKYTQDDQFKLLLPVLLIFLFLLAILTTSGYLMQALTEEKENRATEILITAISPSKMIGGKITGIVFIGITQLLVWGGLIFTAFYFREQSHHWFKGISIPVEIWILLFTEFLLAFVMIAALITMVGAMVTEATEGQQITGPFSIPFIIPYLFLFQFLNDPSSPLAIAFSFFPFTAPSTIILRTSLSVVPTWQILLSITLQIFCIVILGWMAGRAFRAGFLTYNRSISLVDVIRGPQ